MTHFYDKSTRFTLTFLIKNIWNFFETILRQRFRRQIQWSKFFFFLFITRYIILRLLCSILYFFIIDTLSPRTKFCRDFQYFQFFQNFEWTYRTFYYVVALSKNSTTKPKLHSRHWFVFFTICLYHYWIWCYSSSSLFDLFSFL